MAASTISKIRNGMNVPLEDLVMSYASKFAPRVSALPHLMSNTDTPDADQYYQFLIDEADERLAYINSWNDTAADFKAQLDYESALKAHRQSMNHRSTVRDSLEAKLTLVNDWQPPTRDYCAIKSAVITDLENEIKSDSGSSQLNEPKQYTGSQYKQIMLDAAATQLTELVREYETFKRLTKERDEWLASLQQSLRQPSSVSVDA